MADDTQRQGARRARPTGPGRGTMVLLALTAVLGLLFVASVAVVIWSWSSRSGVVNDQSFLALELKGEVPDAPQPGSLLADPNEFPPVVTEITGAIRKAAADDRIRGLYLEVDAPSIGWAGYEEIRTALVDLRAAGKPCVAYSETWTMGGYYVGSACDVVAMAPAGIVLVNGFSVHTTFYAGTFEKIGVKAEMLHVGDFKSAVEPYERTAPSEPAAEAMNALLDSLWGTVVAQIAQDRKLSVEELSARIDRPSLSPQRAVEAGLVDVLAYPDQLRARLHEIDQEGWKDRLAEPVTEDQDAIDERFTKFSSYVAELRTLEQAGGSKIAVLHADGPIMSGEDGGGLFSQAALTDSAFHDWIEDVLEDDDVKAVVVRVNSPGGSALASDMMWHDLLRVKASGRPVVVSMGNYAASGGYYISAPADWIVAQPTTLTGSIGVFGGKLTFNGTYEKLGLTEHAYERGAEADLLSTLEPFSPEGRESYQGFLDDFYETFLGKVTEGRELERDAVHAVAQGRVWSGTQALEHHLVDELGGLDVAVTKAKELASLDEVTLERWPKRKGFFDLLMEDLDANARIELALPGVDEEVLAEVFLLERVLSAGPAAWMPGNLRISE